MKRKLILAAFAAAALAACNDHLPSLSEGESVELEINLPVALTKTTEDSDPTSITTLQVYVFDESDNLEAYGYKYADALSLKCVPGNKTVVALVNAPLNSSISNYAQLTSTVSSLADNVINSLVMEGEMEVELTSSQRVVVPVSRLVAKVTLNKIENAFDLDYHQNMDFVINSVYLINVAGDKKYLSDESTQTWINKSKNDNSELEFLYDSLKDTQIDYGDIYEEEHYFYCYPNNTVQDSNDSEWSPRYTRLVVEATLGGEKCYYPVSLPKVEQNTAYEISLKVTRPGSESPDIPVSTLVAEFTVDVVDWVTTAAIEEII